MILALAGPLFDFAVLVLEISEAMKQGRGDFPDAPSPGPHFPGRR